MKFGNEFWLIIIREYIIPNLFAVWNYKLQRIMSFSRASVLDDCQIQEVDKSFTNLMQRK
jgi:hypothetical protein